jgi:hypothetical protein
MESPVLFKYNGLRINSWLLAENTVCAVLYNITLHLNGNTILY